MVARIACTALAIGVLVGCYNIPQPECGFACGPAGECPSSYACNTRVNRCVLTGTNPSCMPAPVIDAPLDVGPDTPDDLTPPTVNAMITDGAGNAPSSVAWTLTPGADAIGPRVAMTTPADMATAVPTTSSVTVRFDEPVLNVSTTSFSVNAGAITGTVAVPAGTAIATFTPDSPLPGNATISVNLTAAITDATGNAAAPVAFSFITAP